LPIRSRHKKSRPEGRLFNKQLLITWMLPVPKQPVLVPKQPRQELQAVPS
jgi:hypothetical protein